MRPRESTGNLTPELRDLSRGHGAAAEHSIQRLAIDVLHDDEVEVAVAAKLVDLNHVGMAHRRGSSSFVQE